MPIVYCWKLKEGNLRSWAEPFKSDLEVRSKTSPDAEIVKCFLMEYGDYLKLKRQKD